MSVVATPAEGKEIIRQMRVFDGMIVQPEHFGRLTFVLGVEDLNEIDAENLVGELNDLHDEISVYVSSAATVEFDYYVTTDLLPIVRSVVDYYTSNGARLWLWSYRQ